MSYYLKVTKKNDKSYLSIYDGVYDSSTGNVIHTPVETIGELGVLIRSGIEDPISFYKAYAANLNQERKDKNERPATSDYTYRIHYLGYAILKWIIEKLGIEPYLDIQTKLTNFHFSLYEVLTTAIYAQAVKPCSKRAAYSNVMPNLLQPITFSYDQLLEGIDFLGSDYKKYVELFTAQVIKVFGILTDYVFYDGTNFYFEIQHEDNLRRNGPSKENRNSPIVGMGLLLDSGLTPIDMVIYPGNESEKPRLRETINSFKDKHNITGKTVQVADKGLNCAQNIYEALLNRDGYIFSRSVYSISEVEQTWVTLDNGDFIDVRDGDGNLLFKYKSCIETFEYKIYKKGKVIKKFRTREKRVVRYDPALARKRKKELKKLREKAEKHLLTVADAKNKEYGGCGKYITIKYKDGEPVDMVLDEELMAKDEKLAGYNMFVTSETHMDALEIMDIYRMLWHIEEDFRIMKSDLDARPVYLQQENRIKGHFLICYLTVLLKRLLEKYVFGGVFSYADTREFIQKLNFIEFDHKFINVSPNIPLRNYVAANFGVPFIEYECVTQAKLKQFVNKKI